MKKQLATTVEKLKTEQEGQNTQDITFTKPNQPEQVELKISDNEAIKKDLLQKGDDYPEVVIKEKSQIKSLQVISKEEEFNQVVEKLKTELTTADSTDTTKSILLNKIEQVNQGSLEHSDHSSHCSHDRTGGGHGNVCWNDKNDTDLIAENNDSTDS